MAQSKQELPDEQIDVYLEELGIAFLSQQPDAEESSFENLIEEIFETANTSSRSLSSPSLPIPPLTGQKKEKRSHSLVLVTAALLMGLFVGYGFGFFWTKKEDILNKPIVEPPEEISTQISYWISELTNLYKSLEPAAAENEIIEPLSQPEKKETLSPSEMT